MAGNIRGITIEFRGDTSQLSQAINKIREEGKGLDNELRQINRSLRFNPRNLDLWRQKQTLLNQKVQETRRHLNELKQAEKTMRANGIDQNSADFRELQREIIKTENQLKRAEADLRRLSNIRMTVLGEQFKTVGAKMQQIGRSATQYVTVPLALAGGVAAKKFAEVDKIMQLTNQTMGNTADQAKMLDKAMKQAAGNSTYSMNDAATAALNFARAGLNAEQSASALAPAMNLAAGEGGNLDTVSAGLVATINGFGGSFDEAAQYADVFANACNNSALDIDSLSESMKIAAPIFKSAGYSVNDAALYMGVMANKGIPASEAANALKTGMARLVSPAKEGAQWMDKLGISVTNSDGTMKDSVTVQKELHGAFSKLSDSEKIAAASAIFGKNQMSKWLALIDTAPGDVEKLNADLQEQGTVTRMANAMMSGFGGSIEKLKSSIDVAATSLGQALAPIIGKVVQGIQWLVNKFNEMSPAGQRVVAVIGVIAAAIGPLLVVLGVLATAIGSLMTVGPAIAGVVSGALPVIAIIAAVGAAVIALWKSSGKFRKAVTSGVQQIMSMLKGVWKSIKPMLANLKKAIAELIKAIGPIAAKVVPMIVTKIKVFIKVLEVVIKVSLAIATTIVKVITILTQTVGKFLNWAPGAAAKSMLAVKTTIVAVWTAISTFMRTILNSLKAFIASVWSAIKTAITTRVQAAAKSVKTTFTSMASAVKAIWNGLKSAAASAFNAIKTAITSRINAAKSAAVKTFNALKSGISSAVSGIKSAVSSAFSSLKSKMTEPFTSAKAKIKAAIDKIKSIFPVKLGKIFTGLQLPKFRFSGGKAPYGLGGKGTPPSLHWYAKGGIFSSPTIAGIGEAGPEAVVPLDTLWKKLDAIAEAGSGGGAAPVINIYAPAGMDVNALAARVERIMIQRENRRRTAWL